MLLLVLIASFVALMSLAGFFLFRQHTDFEEAPQRQQSSEPQSDQIDATAGWNIVKSDAYGFELKYPNNFFDVGHEPKILAGNCNDNVFPSACPDISNVLSQYREVNAIGGGGSNAVALTINGLPYCFSQTGDAAAGHYYSHYYYTTVRPPMGASQSEKKCLVVYLATSATRCENYLPLEQGNAPQQKNYENCLAANENQPKVLQQIINTFTFAGQ